MASLERITAFSDGIFSIAATVKVININVVYPVEDLGRELRANAQDFAMYFVCFYVIATLWQHHVLLFDRLQSSDEVLMWLNLLLLMVVSLVPYTITVMGAFFADHNGFALNVGVFLLVAALEAAMLYYTHRRRRLLEPTFARQQLKTARRGVQPYRVWHDRVLAAHVALMPLIFFLAYLLSFGHYLAGFAALVLVPASPLLAKAIERRLFRVRLPPTHTLRPDEARNRAINFADGVFSLAITLIVLDIDALEASAGGNSVVDSTGRPLGLTLARALRGNWDQFAAWVLSFVLVALIWSANHSVFAQLERVDFVMVALNTASCAAVGFVPFLSSLISDYSHRKVSDQQLATGFCMMVVFAGSAFQFMLWMYACHRDPARLLSPAARASPPARRHLYYKTAVLPVVSLAIFVVSLVSPLASVIALDAGVVLAVVVLVVLQHREEQFLPPVAVTTRAGRPHDDDPDGGADTIIEDRDDSNGDDDDDVALLPLEPDLLRMGGPTDDL